MKIKISELKANPYRDIKNYPINKEKIEALKDSIAKTGFWDNVLARKHNGHYELAYGHHRLVALKEVFHKHHVIDIPVKELDNATMLHIMADENMDEWHSSTTVVNETVKAVRNYLNDELAKDEVDPSLIDSLSLNGRHSLKDIKSKGVGQTIILKFLGKGWKQWMVQDSLRMIEDVEKGKVSEKALNSFEKTTVARNFAKAAKDHKLSPKTQELVAKKIASNPDVTQRNVEAMVEEIVNPKTKAKPRDKTIKVEELFKAATQKASELQMLLQDIETLKHDGATVENHPAMRLLKTVTRLSKILNRMLNINQ